MKKMIMPALCFVLAWLAGCSTVDRAEAVSVPDGFVSVGAVQYEKKGNEINVGAFEILDHPVTNREYKAFVDAVKYPAPLHWKDGKIPEDQEDYPVIFVNRDDATAYTQWLTEQTGRVYRIPTACEFEVAARGGVMSNDRYFWGNDESLLASDKINFNDTRTRKFDEREKYLKPARWGIRNNLGLYQMAGNVSQLVTAMEDPALSTYKFRLEKPQDADRNTMGGSWMSTKEYLICGDETKQSPGLRYPDIGIRLVRAPEGVDWKIDNRNMMAVTGGKGKIALSWALLSTDTKSTRFNVYRLIGALRNHNGVKLNAEPLYNTSYLDENGIVDGVRYQYRVVAVGADGKEMRASDWGGITAGADEYPVIAKFKPIFTKGGMLPVFGDLEGYGKPGCVIRLDNGCKETSQDPGEPVRLEAFSYTGKSLWRKDIASHNSVFGSASNAPFNVWDMDGDGKAEIVTLLQFGDDNYVAILDGMSGQVKYKTPWDKMATDVSRSSTRIQLSIAYLDGKTPSVVTQTGIYENEIISAFDSKLNRLWTYNSFMETSGSGGHKVEVADVDNDGRQEVIYGTTCLNPDGKLRWSIYCQHPDIISIHDYMPERPGLEVCFIVESDAHAGIYMVDANSGEIIWKSNREDDPVWNHGHTGWTADIWAGSPGMECMANRAGHQDKTYILFSSDGKRLTESFPIGYTPIEWDGDQTRELIGDSGKVVGKFDGEKIVLIPGESPNPIPNSTVEFAADLYGDFRSELVINTVDVDGRPAIMIVTANKPIDKRYVTPTYELDYRLWLGRNKGGGYGSVYEYVLKDTEK